MKSLAPNTLIQNRYLVVQLIGKGGMGEVYLAVDQRLGSAVALKRMLFTDEEALVQSFEREAKTLARLRHPALTKVSDHFTENEHQYLVMEHISGDDLSKRLEATEKGFPLSWVLYWADQLLDALAYLHSHEPPIIHRDIKPQNLKLTTDNHIILLDFGLAKDSVGETRLSTTGDVIAYTPNYASMEQIRGTGTTARSDIYALSATMYQLLSNTVPADALTRADSVLNSLPDPVTPLSELNAEVPSSISQIITKGMSLSAEQRFANAKEMQVALREAYDQFQKGASAETMAFNTSEAAPPVLQTDIKTEQFSAPEVSVPVGEKTEIMPMPVTAEANVTAPPVDFNATIPSGTPFGENAEAVGEKTEVMMPPVSDNGEKTEVIPPEISESIGYETQVSPADYSLDSDQKTEVLPTNESIPVGEKTEIITTNESFPVDEKTEIFASENVSVGEPTALFTTDETAQNVPAFDNLPANQAEEASLSEMTTPIVNYGNQVAELPTNETSNFVASQEVLPPVPVTETEPAEPKTNTAKAGGGKAFLVLGVLALLGVLGIGAAGAGVYFLKPELLGLDNPTPTPAPTIAPTDSPTVEPTAQPTVETVNNSNSENNSSTDLSNTNSNTSEGNLSGSGDKTPRPTQQPTSQPTKQPTQQPTAQPTRPPTPPPGQPPPKTPPPKTPPKVTVTPTKQPTIDRTRPIP